MNDRPDGAPEPPETPPSEKPAGLRNVSVTDRWAPLVRDPERETPMPPKLGQRMLAAALSLVVLALVLWALV